jgi:hypothetical protein
MDLVQAIRGELDQAASHYQNDPYNGTGWTSVTHERIGRLAAQFANANGIACGMPTGASTGGKRIVVCIAGNLPPSIERQFLFDQCWLTYCDDNNSPDNGYCVGCDLALETEWNTNNVDDFHRDFLKLVLGRADIKVMMFWTQTISLGNSIVSQLEQQMRLLRKGGERYLISFFCWEDTAVHHHEIPA